MKRSGPIARKSRLRAKGGRRITSGNDAAYLAWIRTLPCVVLTDTPNDHGWRPAVPAEAHHLRSRNLTGQDKGNAIPLCAACHGVWHSMGRQSFQRWASLDANAAAQRLADQYDRETGG